MRDKLIEFIKQAKKQTKNANCDIERNMIFADYLLENGVIVPPCKVGDTVYILAGHNGHKYEKDICEGFYIGDDGVVQVRTRNNKGNHCTYGVIGKTVFLTREEAEKALEERRKNETK